MNYHRFDCIIVGAGGAGLMAALESSRQVGTAEQAEDLTQEAFCKAQLSLAQLRDTERAKPW